jgi:hypothetical protein
VNIELKLRRFRAAEGVIVYMNEYVFRMLERRRRLQMVPSQHLFVIFLQSFRTRRGVARMQRVSTVQNDRRSSSRPMVKSLGLDLQNLRIPETGTHLGILRITFRKLLNECFSEGRLVSLPDLIPNLFLLPLVRTVTKRIILMPHLQAQRL